MVNVFSYASRGRSDGEWYTSPHQQRLEIGTHISNALSSLLKDFMVYIEYD